MCELLRNNDVCLIQEHWLLHEKLNLQDIDTDFFFHGVSSMDSVTLLCGHPYGGCAIFIENLLSSGLLLNGSVLFLGGMHLTKPHY